MKNTEKSNQCSTSARDWMKEALVVAGQASIDVPVGCVIVKDGKVIAAAHNRREVDKDPVGHAEILAIREAARFWIAGGWTAVLSLPLWSPVLCAPKR